MVEKTNWCTNFVKMNDLKIWSKMNIFFSGESIICNVFGKPSDTQNNDNIPNEFLIKLK